MPHSRGNLNDAGTKSVLSGNIVYEILSAIVVGLLLSVLWIYSVTYKLITRFLQAIRATKKYGDEDVWDYVFNSPSPSVEYINFGTLKTK
jgi:hypothetical protein